MKKFRTSLLLFVVVTLALSVFIVASPSFSQEKPIELTYSCPYTLNIPYAKAARAWLDWIEKELEDKE